MRGLLGAHLERTAAPLLVFRLLLVALLATALTSCGSDAAPTAAATIETSAHTTGTCSSAFEAHDLDHITNGPGDTASTFDGTGAGAAVGDLDNDGDLDIVLPNLSGATRVMENVGDFRFVPHELILGRFRGAATVDVDADGHLDIVLTTGIGPPVLFTNAGDGIHGERYERSLLPNVKAATYAMAWSDLGGDGDLDLVTGSYNAELTMLRNSPVLGADTGVVLHEAGPDGFETNRLSPTAQSLAMAIADINNDGALDILVGNDLATEDMIFLDSDDGWERDEPFTTTSYSTMSYDAADLDGDGRVEFFSTDMAPMADANLDDYREVFADMEAAPRPDDVQTPENVLLRQDDDGNWTNDGRNLGIEATGWSWSGLFGDLDNDGAQDLYVVNGMRSDLLFDFLPDARLVERNQAFRSVDGAMEPATQWGLDDPAGGRGAVLADFDNDGDLDIVINNLDEPSRVYENQLCTGSALTVELHWTNTQNINALGATVIVERDGITQRRLVTSTRGYLSGAPPVVHIGIGDSAPSDISVVWPDGAVSEHGLFAPDQHVVLTRTR